MKPVTSALAIEVAHLASGNALPRCCKSLDTIRSESSHPRADNPEVPILDSGARKPSNITTFCPLRGLECPSSIVVCLRSFICCLAAIVFRWLLLSASLLGPALPEDLVASMTLRNSRHCIERGFHVRIKTGVTWPVAVQESDDALGSALRMW